MACSTRDKTDGEATVVVMQRRRQVRKDIGQVSGRSYVQEGLEGVSIVIRSILYERIE